MEHYGSYVAELRNTLDQLFVGKVDDGVIWSALNGGPSRELRRLVAVNKLREIGAFFTPSVLAQKLIALHQGNPAFIYFDPACGCGDLLLAAANNLPVQSTLSATLKVWGTKLLGVDQVPEFIQATRIRLALAAINRGVKVNIRSRQLVDLLPGIQCGDGLRARRKYQRATHVLLNPPYSMAYVPDNCDWRGGSVSMAALFMIHCLESISDGTTVLALLPEVLRTGATYERWRNKVNTHATFERLKSHGQFAPWCDVDVFSAAFVKTDVAVRAAKWLTGKTTSADTIGTQCRINVGTVVPHRHKKIGKKYAYIHAKSVPAWTRVKRITERRRFSGRTFAPPFVVVRRTSRPNDQHRAVASVVLGKRNVAVENHLIVLTPKLKGQKACDNVVRVLKSESTSKWLNKRICCRHLTVSALQSVPWKT